MRAAHSERCAVCLCAVRCVWCVCNVYLLHHTNTVILPLLLPQVLLFRGNNIMHTVLPVTNGTRHSLVAFFHKKSKEDGQEDEEEDEDPWPL